MNEEELKEIWKKDKTSPIQNIDFERIKKIALKSQKKLRNKIKKDIAVNILLYVLVIPIFLFRRPETLFFLPFVTVIWIWYLWEVLRIYKYDTDFQKPEHVKDFLIGKERLLTNYIKRTRYIGYLGTPIIWSLFFLASMPLQELWNSRAAFFLILVFLEIIVLISFELYIKKIYVPVIDELRDLLQQLNDNDLQ